MKLFTALVFLAVSAFAHAADKPDAGAAAMKRTLQAQMLAHLKDGPSARLGRMELHRSDDPPAVALCGEVNAKNSYGGYVGDGLFVSTSTGVVVFETSEPDAIGAVWKVWCSLPY